MVVKCREQGQGVFKLVNNDLKELNSGDLAKSNLLTQEERDSEKYEYEFKY